MKLEGKKPRVSAPKTRTGCAVCKTRRVKCDERKPGCSRCEKAGWPCQYLPPKKMVAAPKIIRKILPLGEAFQKSHLHERHSLHLFVPPLPRPREENEYRYFQLFETSTAPGLTGDYGSNVWNGLILQACHRENYAWHAVVAIGALHKSLIASQLWKSRYNTIAKPSDDGKAHHLFALQQYSKALQLMKRIQEEGDESRFQNSLIASLLTICFESYLGNQKLALDQIRTSINILFQWSSTYEAQDDDVSNINMMSKRNSFLDEDLLSTFILLDFQAMAFGYGHTNWGLNKKYPHPARFETIKEARVCFDVINRRIQQFLSSFRSESNPYFSNELDEHSHSDVMVESAAQVAEYIKATSAWYDAFKPLFDIARPRRGSKDYFAAAMLMARCIPSRFLISADEASELHCDAYLPECTLLVSLMEEVMDHDPLFIPGQATFVFGSHCVLALFFMSLHCRDPAVRRRAISLLVKYPRREGLWDSLMAATVASWVMIEEEKGMVQHGFIPESARLRMVKNDFLLAEKKTIVQCSRLTKKGSKERTLLPEVTLSW